MISREFEIKYIISFKERKIIPEDISELDLRYDYFYCETILANSQTGKMIALGVVPIFDFALALAHIADELVKANVGSETYEYTESELYVTFERKDGILSIVHSGYSNSIDCSFSSFYNGVVGFYGDCLKELHEDIPSLRKNAIFQAFYDEIETRFSK